MWPQAPSSCARRAGCAGTTWAAPSCSWRARATCCAARPSWSTTSRASSTPCNRARHEMPLRCAAAGGAWGAVWASHSAWRDRRRPPAVRAARLGHGSRVFYHDQRESGSERRFSFLLLFFWGGRCVQTKVSQALRRTRLTSHRPTARRHRPALWPPRQHMHASAHRCSLSSVLGVPRPRRALCPRLNRLATHPP